jgi:hypothetical protein
LNLVSDWVRHAEGKAGAALAGSVAVVAGLFTLWQASAPEWDCPQVLSAALALLGFLASAGFSIASLTPRLRVKTRARQSPSPLYFADIAAWPSGRDGYLAAALELAKNPELVAAELARQVLANSVVATRKFHLASWAVAALAVQIVLTAVHCAILVGQATAA